MVKMFLRMLAAALSAAGLSAPAQTAPPSARPDPLDARAPVPPVVYRSSLPTARTADPRLGKRANDVRESLLSMGSASERCARTVGRCAPAGLVGDDARILAPLVERTLRSASEATAVIGQLVKDSGT